jgi:arginine utilization protein RocB
MPQDTRNQWFPLVRDLTLKLVRFPSVTNTPGEVAFAQHLHGLLAAHPYFQANPGHLRIERAPDDPRGRSNVFALVHGGPRAIVLTGHYDIVSIENYGDLAPYACLPEALLPRLIADLEAGARSEADQLAIQDLRSGDYLPGRGALDMKSGLAAGVALLFHLAELDARPGSLLLVATPDEEQTSQGMRAAAARLPSLAGEWGQELLAAINLDSTTDRGDGSAGRAIFLGSVGKLLPSVYVVGRDTHAGAPFDGVSANLLAAEITRRIECSPDLADMAAGEAAPPPVCLKQADLKLHYDVTTPAAAWCYYNLLTYSWTPTQALAKIVRSVQEALDTAMAELQERARRYATLTGSPVAVPSWRPQALTFAELKRRALDRSADAAHGLAELHARLADDPEIDLPTCCLRTTELLWKLSGLTGPAAVVGLAALYYPRVSLGDTDQRHTRLRAAVVRQAAALARETGAAIRLRPFFPGISDMSFLGGADAPEELELVAANTPAWGTRIRFDYGALSAAAGAGRGLPVVNVGPWGRDYHQRSERVYMPYAFDTLPELVWRIAGDLLAGTGDKMTG